MKRILTALCSLFLVLSLVSCSSGKAASSASSSSSAPSEPVEEKTKTMIWKDCSFEVPESWESQEDEDQLFLYPDGPQSTEHVVLFQFLELNIAGMEVMDILNAGADGMLNVEGVTGTSKKETTIAGNPAIVLDYVQTRNDVGYIGHGCLFPAGEKGVLISVYLRHPDAAKDMTETYDKVVDSFKAE